MFCRCLMVVALHLVALSLNGCGSGGDTPTPSPSPPAETTTVTTTTVTTATTTTTTTTTLSRSTTCQLDSTQGTWCVVADDASDDAVQNAVEYVCQDQGAVDCSACISKDLRVRARWAFNEYFHTHMEYGAQSCNFTGAAKLDYPEFSRCKPSLAHDKWCQPKPGVSQHRMQKALEFVCGHGVDCASIGGGGSGQCVFDLAVDLQRKCEWAFDAYYHKHPSEESCNFDGVGQVVTAPCGDYNHGNPQTGRGYAYPNPSCNKNGTAACGCIEDPKTHDWTGCRACVTKNPKPDNCEYVCPWLQPDSFDSWEDDLFVF